MSRRLTTAALAAALAAFPAFAQYNAPASFRVTGEVAVAAVGPFSAVAPSIGNSLSNEGAGFEPPVFRSRYRALEAAPDRIVGAPFALTQSDTLREGYLDGAEVSVYRIENGVFSLVRQDRVAAGGHRASGWLPATRLPMVVAPERRAYLFRWEPWNRPRAKYYFAVRTVDRAGNVSAPSNVLAAEPPAQLLPGGGAATPLVRLGVAAPGNAPSSLPAPRNLRGRLTPEGALALEWDPVAGPEVAGYAVVRSDYPPEQHAGYYLALAQRAASAREQIRAGDMAVVSKKFYSVSRNRSLSNRAWGADRPLRLLAPGMVRFFPDEDARKSWQLVPHAAATPVEEPGETYLRITLGAGASEYLALSNHSGREQDWYPVLEPRPYRVEAWLRAEAPGRVRFRFGGFYGQAPHAIAPLEFEVGPAWRKYAATFTPPAVQESRMPGQMGLEFTGPGTFSVDNFRVYRADTAYLDYLPEQYAELKAARTPALRAHGTAATYVRTYDIAQLTNPGGVASHIGGWASGAPKLNTLPQILQVMRKAGIRPWLQVEPHFTPQEWRAFVEYLAAPYTPGSDTPASKPWAYKRHAQGQARPWSEEFDRIYLEIGNETWNFIYDPWIFEDMTDAATGRRYNRGEVYGLYQEYVAAALRSSPYWKAAGLDAKLEMVLGGGIRQSYGRDAARVSPSSRYLTIGAYNGGWDEGEGAPRLDAVSLFNVLAHANQVAIPMAELHAREVLDLQRAGHPALRAGTYEAGPGYALDGLNNDRVTPEQARAQEQAMKSLAAGTATLDSFLAHAYRGFALQNFFAFDGGMHWKSHARWHRGGHAYPSWKWLALFNREATGAMLRTETLSVPVVDLAAAKRRLAAPNAPLAAVYATRSGSRVSVFVISRKVPDYPVAGDAGFTPVTLELPFRRAAAITLHRMAGDPKSNNVERDEVRIDTVPLAASALADGRLVLSAASGADARGLPPAATFLYVFDAVQ